MNQTRPLPWKSWDLRTSAFPFNVWRGWAGLLALLIAMAHLVLAQDESPAAPEPGVLSPEVPLFDPAAKPYFCESREASEGGRTVHLTDVRWDLAPFAPVLDWYAAAFGAREIPIAVRRLDDGRRTALATFAVEGDGTASVFLCELNAGGVRLHVTQSIPQTVLRPLSFGRELPRDFPASIPRFDAEAKPYSSKRYQISQDVDWNGGERTNGFTATDVRWDLDAPFETVSAWYASALTTRKVALTVDRLSEGRGTARALLHLSQSESASIDLVELESGGVRLHIVWCAPPRMADRESR